MDRVETNSEGDLLAEEKTTNLVRSQKKSRRADKNPRFIVVQNNQPSQACCDGVCLISWKPERKAA